MNFPILITRDKNVSFIFPKQIIQTLAMEDVKQKK